jgi:hypothetical protein
MIGLRRDVSPRFVLRAGCQRNAWTWMPSRLASLQPAATEKDGRLYSLLASFAADEGRE